MIFTKEEQTLDSRRQKDYHCWLSLIALGQLQVHVSFSY